MPLIAGTGMQAYIALLCFLVGLAMSPLYEWTRPLKRKNKVMEILLDAFFTVVSAGVFLLFTHTVLKGRLSTYTVVSFYAGAALGVFLLRKCERALFAVVYAVVRFFRSKFCIFGGEKPAENTADAKKSKMKKKL